MPAKKTGGRSGKHTARDEGGQREELGSPPESRPVAPHQRWRRRRASAHPHHRERESLSVEARGGSRLKNDRRPRPLSDQRKLRRGPELGPRPYDPFPALPLVVGRRPSSRSSPPRPPAAWFLAPGTSWAPIDVESNRCRRVPLEVGDESLVGVVSAGQRGRCNARRAGKKRAPAEPGLALGLLNSVRNPSAAGPPRSSP